MGQLKTDGRATQGGVTFPAGDIVFGDLYRVDGVSGFALKNIATTASGSDRKAGMEISKERVWYVKLPAAVTGARGDLLYWTAGAGFKRGDTDLTATVTGQPIVQVEEAKDANHWAAVRLTGLG